MAALSSGIRKNGERRINRATSIRTSPAPMMPTSDHFSDPGAVCSDLTTTQARNTAEANGRMPTSIASQVLLKMRRR